MAETPTSLGEVRARIDAVDAALLRLLDERAGLAVEMRRAKPVQDGEALPFGLDPARETQVLRRLLADSHPNASTALIVRIWREVMADDLHRQAPFGVAVFGGRDPARMVDLARLRFGAAPAVTLVDKAETAIAAAKAPGGIGLLPLEGVAPWARLLAEPDLRVFAVLPCLAGWGRPQALAVAKVAVEPSGADQTLWVTDAPAPVDSIVEALGRRGLAAGLLAEGGGLRLFALPGYIQSEDARLVGAPGRLTGVIGAAPTPFDL
jgi:chorismate mutase